MPANNIVFPIQIADWCNGNTTDFGSVFLGSSPGSATTHYIKFFSYMSFNKSIAIEIASEAVSDLLKALFGELEKQHHAGEFSHPALVSVKFGDGIGFDAGEVVMVSNAKNNVNMLFKANYDEPFPVHKKLRLSKNPVLSKDDLVPGRTYLVEEDDRIAFIKYLGHSIVLVRACNSMAVTSITTNDIPPHYEISVPSSNSK